MLNKEQTQRLLKNWGDKANSLACYAEVRVYDPISAWQCFLLAMNPEDEQEFLAIVSPNSDIPATIETWTLPELTSLYNSQGESVEVDHQYRRRRAAEVFKSLNIGI